jgi:hypothetical protein
MNRAAFDALLQRARLPVTDEEYERLLRISEVVDRHMADLRIPEARNEEPASIYPAADRSNTMT